MKAVFIKKEIWLLTIGGAFQRANVYQLGINENVKKEFRNKLQRFIDEILEKYNNAIISDETHIENIYKINQFSAKNYSAILTNGQLNFGVCQKLLNLYLKYQWCLNLTSTPPHFPVDRIIQQKLKVPTLYSWTKNLEEKEYLEVINHARKEYIAKGYTSIADQELQLFSRN